MDARTQLSEPYGGKRQIMRLNTIIVLAGVALVLIISYVIVFGKQKPTPATPTPPRVVSPIPLPSYQTNTPKGVTFTFAPSFSLTLPKEATIYQATPINASSLAATIVTKLASTPTTKTLSSGGEKTTTWTWPTGSAAMTIQTNGIRSFYFSDISPSGEGWLLLDFLKLLTPSSDVVPVLESDPAPIAGAFNFPYNAAFGVPTRYTYFYGYRGVPLLLGGPEERAATIVVDAKERVRYATFLTPIQGVSALGTTPVISQNEILSNLNAQKGYFVGSNRELFWENDNPIRFTSVQIRSGKMAYLFDPSLLRLVPIIALDGVGSDASSSASVRYLLNAAI